MVGDSPRTPARHYEINGISEPLLSTAVAIIYLYMLTYTMYNGWSDVKHEDFIDCQCKTKDKNFYTALFTVFTIVWSGMVFSWTSFRICDLRHW